MNLGSKTSPWWQFVDFRDGRFPDCASSRSVSGHTTTQWSRHRSTSAGPTRSWAKTHRRPAANPVGPTLTVIQTHSGFVLSTSTS